MVRTLLTFLISLGFIFGMELKKVSESIYMAQGVNALPSKENRGFMSNAYAVLTDEGWVVVDTLSTPELGREFISELKKIKDAPILYAIVTHYHMDHWFGASAFKEAGAKIVAHKNLKDFYDSGEADSVLNGVKSSFPGVFDNVKLTPPDVVVDSRVKLRVGNDTFLIIPMTPAHTNTDIVVFKNRVLFAGDLTAKRRIVFMGDRNASSKGWVEVLNKLKELKPKLVLSGHGEPGGLEVIKETQDYIAFVRENVARLKDEGKFIDEIREALKDTPYKNLPMYDVFHLRNVYRVFNELDMEL
ncbi:glyoxylase-like metal-dependent hydrolase (beta-lactamase superfamily II) [Hydrogenivirga caldilitoris]|uniref:Glyoxylase-like metal-dependent hydrolase (Beta-lactamase superfamily II) n=1 Tax=Hydrogenivirga caldilitoris TaxID=246264 RepID=A0A497XQC6_9AQUI|nr:MBL fold metallo-hydrolase [Hydrogenivirga caldilitoris]RLJ71186.1 glyoxylase-like metal-dependent hydrolase (beta-lactamase superfamily II) [Hydrogenivirga caldilitoris]